MTGVTSDGLELDRDIAATPAVVFAALTEAPSFARWFGTEQVEVSDVEYVAEAGRPWQATMTLPDGGTINWQGRFVTVQPPSRLELTMSDQPGDDAGLPIVFELSAIGEDKTALHLAQRAPDFSEEQREATLAGWSGFIDVVQRIAEEAQALPAE